VKDKLFKQCILERDGFQQYSWIPFRGALVGAVVQIKERSKGKQWESGWKVVQVFNSTVTKEFIDSHGDDYRHQREVSDI
jgi:hypothetical protein